MLLAVNILDSNLFCSRSIQRWICSARTYFQVEVASILASKAALFFGLGSTLLCAANVFLQNSADLFSRSLACCLCESQQTNDLDLHIWRCRKNGSNQGPVRLVQRIARKKICAPNCFFRRQYERLRTAFFCVLWLRLSRSSTFQSFQRISKNALLAALDAIREVRFSNRKFCNLGNISDLFPFAQSIDGSIFGKQAWFAYINSILEHAQA